MSCALDLLRRLESDARLRARFESAASHEALLSLMAANGCNCTVAELEHAVERRRNGEMSETELCAISGGSDVPDNLLALLTALRATQ